MSKIIGMILRVPESLSDEQIEKFRVIYRKIFNVDISKDEAEKEGLSLVRFIALVIGERGN